MWGVCVERFQPTVTIFATRFGAQGEEVGCRGGVATCVRASLQESMVGRLRGGVEMPGETRIEQNKSGSMCRLEHSNHQHMSSLWNPRLSPKSPRPDYSW